MLEDIKKQNTKLIESDVLDLSDGDSNRVYQVNGKYLYKEFIDKNRLEREVTGFKLFNMLSKHDIPLLISQGENHLVSEYIKDSQTCFECLGQGNLTSDQISVKVASILAQNYWGYKMFGKTKIGLFPLITWKKRMEDICTEFSTNISFLINLLGESATSSINDVSRNIRRISRKKTWNSMTLTHRDIHLENILVSNDKGYNKFYIIDFEHSMEAPIELEFSNSLFWNDEKSLDVKAIVSYLVGNYMVPFDESLQKELIDVYFAEQLNLAIKDQNLKKVYLLVKKYQKLKNS